MKKYNPIYIVAAVMLLSACGDTEPVKDLAEDAAAVVENVVTTDELCLDAGPQTPRDIASLIGSNPVEFPMAPAASELNLCNIHTHTNAEHKGPGFSVFVDDSDHGGYACNETDSLTEAELAAPEGTDFGYVKPGDTIEVHWVHSSCDIQPGEGLGSCLSDTCENPLLRVEAQTFLVVNDPEAADFTSFGYDTSTGGEGMMHQAKAIPSGTGDPVVFRGSTTGPSYTQAECSPLHVTWSVRPSCTKVDINSLNKWAKDGNVFNEKKSHGVRQLVTAPELLSPIG